MLSNNNQRLNIWLSLNNRFSYKEFSIACISQNVDILSISEFAQKVGMISVAMTEYPDLEPDKAYLKLVERMNQSYSNNTNNHVNNKPQGGCSSCGKQNQISDGGKVV